MNKYDMPLRILAHGTDKHYKKNSTIFVQDENAEKIFYLKKGCVRFSFYCNNDEKRNVLFYAGEGDFLGVEAVLTGGRTYGIDAEAVHDCQVIAFTKIVFLVLLENSELSNYCLLLTCQRFMTYINKVNSLSCFLDCHKRIASVLLWLTEQNSSIYNNSKIKLSHKELGELSNVHRVTTTKVLQNLENTNVIQKKFKTIIITPEKKRELKNFILQEES